MPYLYQVDSILNRLYNNGSINAIEFPIFTEESWQKKTWMSEAYGFFIYCRRCNESNIKPFGSYFIIHISWVILNPYKANSQKFSFFITAKYDFQTKIWDSGGFEIDKDRWAQTNENELVYPIINDRLLLVRQYLKWSSPYHWGAIDCGVGIQRFFKLSPFSSNDHHFNSSNRNIYIICRMGSKLKFRPVPYFKQIREKCVSPFTPKTTSDFESILKHMDNFTFEKNINYNVVRFWTDYVRINQTHFWSKSAKNWWSQCRTSDLDDPNYTKFEEIVTIDGYKKLKNHASLKTGCICVERVISYKTKDIGSCYLGYADLKLR